MGILPLLFASIGLPLGAGLTARFLFGTSRRITPVTGLVFHSITTRFTMSASHCPRPVFAQFTRMLREQDIVTHTVTHASSTQSPGCCLTFDDGFADFYDTALPLLTEYGLTATVFPVAGFVGSESVWDVFPKRHHLTAPQLREIAKKGHEIGSHTSSHPDLTLCSPKALDRELHDSKARLEDILGKPVTSLSFPCGRWDRRVWEAAREVGFTAATIYTNHGRAPEGTIPVWGTYAFDTAQDLLEKLTRKRMFSEVIAGARVMPHFAKGTSLWLFRKEYRLP